ncbi:cyclase family protein [Solihabitans fulvus]|uniref:Cyclase family protein n=1 Tax=Solihabitans fulvus TaxID=1892852 RepID=A0A5B2WQW8_9PSEU|nr:cyclase family protein [Solihabitans fulvus]KAA2252849.1 cyclase family protein [Solihabitans fulvus]
MTRQFEDLSAVLTECAVTDLSLLLAEDYPCYWSTHQPFQHKTWNWFVTDRGPAGNVYSRGGPYATKWLALDEHTGTHMDAPCHFVPPPDSGLPDAGPAGAITVADVPPAQLMGPAAVIDATGVAGTAPGVSPAIGQELVLDWERVNGRLRAGDVVLFRTGWDRHYLRGAAGEDYLHNVVVTGRRPGWPAPDVPAMELLLRRGVRCVGIDAPSMGAAHDARPVHLAGLRAGAVFVECLTRLDLLPARDSWFCFLPLRVEGGTGAPGRAIAFTPITRPDIASQAQ